MEERLNDIRVRCRLNILRLYPAHRQSALTDRTDFDAWKAENVAHMQKLQADEDADIDEGWPDPSKHQRRSAAESMLSELEDVKAKLDEREVHEEPPAAIADLFQPDKPLAPQAEALQRLWVQLGHQIQRGEASVDQIRKHERLSSELEFINKHAFDGV